MAIANITKAIFRPFRRRSKSQTGSPPPEPTSPAAAAVMGKQEEFRRVFRYLDANNDGKISAGELRDYFASIGDALSDDEAERIIKEFSDGGSAGAAEGSLLLDFEQFVGMMELRDGDDKVLREAFEVYVADDGGAITPEGLRRVLRRLGYVKSYQECEAMISVFDLDGNGVVDFHEFHKMMT